MATPIDALFVTLGLDASGFKRESKEVVETTKKTKNEVERHGKGIAQSMRTVEESIAAVSRNFLALFALLSGANSLKDFAQQTIGADFALGRLAKSVGSAPEAVAAMSNAVERSGGSAEAAQASFRKLSDSFEEVKTFGTGAIVKPMSFLIGEGHHDIDYFNGMEKALPGIIANLQTIAKEKGLVHAIFMGKQAGIDEGTVMLMVQGLAKFNAEVAKSKKLGVPQKEWVETTGALIESYRTLAEAAQDLGRKILVGLSPYLKGALEWMAQWITANKEWIDTKIEAAFRAFGDVVSAVVNSSEMKGFVRWMSSGETWAPFLSFLKQIGSAEYWKPFIGFISRALDQLHELYKLIDVLTGGGKNSADWDKNHKGFFGRDERAEMGLPPLGENDGPISANEGIYNRSRTGRRLGRGGGASGGAGSRTTYHDNTNYTGSNAEVLRQAAAQLGTTPEDLATVISYETRGTFSPRIHGGYSKKYGAGAYHGLIQAGPDERAQFDINDKQTFAEQMPGVVSYLKTRGFKPHMGLLDLYSTINAGSPGHYNYRDVNGSVREHVERMQREHRANARRFLSAPSDRSPGAPRSEHTSWLAPIPNAANFRGMGGAAHVAQAHSTTNHHDNRSSSSEVHVGSVTVQTQATDAPGIAKDIKPAIQRYAFLDSNYGMA